MENKTNGWKIAAIIFIILFASETALIIWSVNIAIKSDNNEKECLNNICENPIYTSYFYNPTEKICYCYEGNKVMHQEFLK